MELAPSAMSTLYSILVALVAVYIATLVLLNQIPHFRVSSLGWLSLRNITIESNGTVVRIGKIRLWLNLAWSSDTPYRMVNLGVFDVEVQTTSTGSKGPRCEKKPDLPDKLVFTMPGWVYVWLFKRKWMNQIQMHLFRCSFYHHAVSSQISLHLDYTRLENFYSVDSGLHRFSFSVLDGYVRDQNSTSEQRRVFRNWDISVDCDLVFTCPLDKKNKMMLALHDLGLQVSMSNLDIPNIPHFLQSSEKKEPKNTDDLPAMDLLLKIFNLISMVEIKVENSTIEYKDLRARTSSLSLSLVRERNFTLETWAKVSAYVTSAKLYHLDLRCVEVPSMTYLFECDLTELYLAYETKNFDKYVLDFATTLNMTNPTFDVYFDQLGDVIPHSVGKSAPKHHLKEISKTQKMCLPFARFIRKVRKASIKIVVVDTKLTLHLPNIDTLDFHRDSVNNVITRGTLLMLAFKCSTKNLGKLLQNVCHRSGPNNSLKGFVKVKNFRVQVEENEVLISKLNTLVGFCLDTHRVTLKVVSKHTHVKSVNSMIFYVVRRLKENRINHYNAACAKLKSINGCSVDDGQAPEDPEKALQQLYVDIFELLPDSICSVKFRSSLLQVIIICKDGLPSHVMYDEAAGKEVDLNEFKRGVSLAIEDFLLDFKRSTELFLASVGLLQAFTISEFATEYTETFDDVLQSKFQLGDIDFSDVSSLESASEDVQVSSDELSRVKRVLDIHHASLQNPQGVRDKLVLSIPEVDGRLNIFLVWCVVYAQTLVKQFSPKVKRSYSQAQIEQLQSSKKKFNLDLQIDSVSIVTRLPKDVDVLLEVDLLCANNVFDSPAVRLKYCRLYVVHPATSFWTRLVSVADISVNLEDLLLDDFAIFTKSFRFNIPHKFLVYTVIDNVMTMAKSIKQILQNFTHLSKDIHDYSRILPQAKPALKIPRVRLKSDIFGITLENDPFEAELALIYQLGAEEQIERIKKQSLFDEKVKEILSQVAISLTEAEPLSPLRFLAGEYSSKSPKFSKFKETPMGRTISGAMRNPFTKSTISSNGSSSGSKSKDTHSSEVDGSDLISEEEASKIIETAQIALQRDFSRSWVSKFRKFKRSQRKTWDERGKSVWGEDEINPLMKNKFQIQGYARGHPLFYGLFNDFDLIIDEPKISDIDEFLRIYGKGQPKFQYSILIPVYIRLRSSSVCVGVKDYVLPLLSFPSNSVEGTPTMDFHGNFVINEKLIELKEELRNIFVPFLPAASMTSDTDNFYSAFIPRTLAPVKVMFDLSCELKTDRACVISWCKSYQAAILNVLLAFDNFTKPQIDDSPLGWWDKISLIMHGKLKFEIENELCFHIKSSTSPYDLVGKHSGFVWCWKNDVLLRFNDTGKQSELIVLDSHDFILGIPNYSTTEKRTWSLFYSELHDYVYDVESESKKFQKHVMNFTSDEKVVWKLGFLFERNKDITSTELSSNQERTNEFKPHYDVVVTGPQYEYHPDSYEMYRSDYLHLAISVTSKSAKGNCYNAAYFTPLTFYYFFHWWHTISNTISLPIREGSLFPGKQVDKSHVSMGPHLVTFKYQLVLEPLTISHMFRSFKEDGSGQRVVCTGVKGKFSKCCIDLHQRREVVRYVNDKLGIVKKVRHLKLNSGEIDVSNADVRIVNAEFKDTSVKGSLVSYYTGQTDQLMDVEDFEHERMKQAQQAMNTDGNRGFNIADEDFLWLDPADFIELEEREVLSADPHVTITPFLCTPKFTFFREFSLEIPEGMFPFGGEASHDCLIGAQSPDEVQAELLQIRADNIKKELDANTNAFQMLKDLNNPIFNADHKRIQTEISQGEQKLGFISKMLNDITGLCEASKMPEIGTPTPPRGSGMNLEALLLTGNDRPGIASPAPLKNTLSYLTPPQQNGSRTDLDTVSLNRYDSRAPSMYSNYRSIDQARDVISTNASVSKFHNRFLVHNLQLKWNNEVRDLFLNYISLIGDRKTEVLSMTRKAVDLIESLAQGTDLDEEGLAEGTGEGKNRNHSCGGDVIDGFEEYLGHLESDAHEIENKYLIKLIQPQIQLLTESDPNSCVVVTSQDLEMRIIRVNLEGTKDVINEGNEEFNLVETRQGALFRESHIFVFHKDEFPDFTPNPFGDPQRKKTWPPWVDLEVCSESLWLQDKLVVERSSMALFRKEPNLLSVESRELTDTNEIIVHLAKLVINATSKQYSSIYFILTDLLMNEKTSRDALYTRIDQIMEMSDLQNMTFIGLKVTQLQKNIRICRFILLKLDERTVVLTDNEQRNKDYMEIAMERMKIELAILIRGLKFASVKRRGNREAARYWTVNADQVIWHLLEDNGEPLVDFALAASKFTRVDLLDGSNSNVVEVSMIQGFNLQRKAVYPELLRPYLEILESKKHAEACKKEEPIIKMTWKMLNPVGGIRIMSNAELKIQALHIQLDYGTATKLFAYLFPKEENAQTKENSPVLADEALDDTYSTVSVSTGEASLNPFRRLLARKKRSESSDRGSLPSHSMRGSSLREESSADSSVISSEKSQNSERQARQLSRLQKKSSNGKMKDKKDLDEIALILNRSSKYFVMDEIKVDKMKLCVSFKAPKHLNIIDVHNLTLSIPTLHYKNKTWSGEDFALQLKKDIIKIVLAHTGKIIGNKFKHRKKNDAEEPLKQILDYSQYMTLQDLQTEGRSRAEAKQAAKQALRDGSRHATVSATSSNSHRRPVIKKEALPREVDFGKILAPIGSNESQ